MRQRVYVGAPYVPEDRPGVLEIDPIMQNETLRIPLHKIKGIELEFMYWRKANAIHRWFVENVQDGVDDCREYYVDPEKLKDLYRDLTKAILSQDANVLPTSNGFFFGSTEADQYYWGELQRTVEQLKILIDEWKKPYNEQDPLIRNSDFYYSSSW
jgi:hypothetical protein